MRGALHPYPQCTPGNTEEVMLFRGPVKQEGLSFVLTCETSASHQICSWKTYEVTDRFKKFSRQNHESCVAGFAAIRTLLDVISAGKALVKFQRSNTREQGQRLQNIFCGTAVSTLQSVLNLHCLRQQCSSFVCRETTEIHPAPLRPSARGMGSIAREVAFVPALTVHMNGAGPECPTSWMSIVWGLG